MLIENHSVAVFHDKEGTKRSVGDDEEGLCVLIETKSPTCIPKPYIQLEISATRYDGTDIIIAYRNVDSSIDQKSTTDKTILIQQCLH